MVQFICWAIVFLILFWIVKNIYEKMSSFMNDQVLVRNKLNVLFGVPGSGKSCDVTQLAYRFAKQGVKVYCNVDLDLPDDLKGMVEKIDFIEDVGNCAFTDCEMIIDEAGVDLNNRDFKKMTPQCRKFLKYHRHFRCGMWYFSQSYNDMDITVRRLADNYFNIRKSIFFFLNKKIVIKKIDRRVAINELTKQLDDEYRYVPFSTFVFSAKKYFKMFDSYSTYDLPTWKQWQKIKAKRNQEAEQNKTNKKKAG